MNESVGLGALFLSSFLAATLLPGGSELVFAAVLASGAASVWSGLFIALGKFGRYCVIAGLVTW